MALEWNRELTLCTPTTKSKGRAFLSVDFEALGDLSNLPVPRRVTRSVRVGFASTCADVLAGLKHPK